MPRISNTDQILLLLRQQLQRMSGKSKTDRTKRPSAEALHKTTVGRMKALSQLGELSDEDFERALIQGLLLDEFGEGLVNDHRFQRLVDKVAAVINSDEKSRDLLRLAKTELIS